MEITNNSAVDTDNDNESDEALYREWERLVTKYDALKSGAECNNAVAIATLNSSGPNIGAEIKRLEGVMSDRLRSRTSQPKD